MSEFITIQPELTPPQALALAQLMKRISWSDCRGNAVDSEEAYTMIAACAEVQRALAEVGYAPR